MKGGAFFFFFFFFPFAPFTSDFSPLPIVNGADLCEKQDNTSACYVLFLCICFQAMDSKSLVGKKKKKDSQDN